MITAIGVDLPVMVGSRPHVHLTIHYVNTVITVTLNDSMLTPHRALLPPLFRSVLAPDARPRERRQHTLVADPPRRFPDRFFSATLANGGLPLDQGRTPLRLQLDLRVDEPLPYPPIFYIKGNNPPPHPFGALRWSKHPLWTTASALGPIHQTDEEWDNGRVVRSVLVFR